MRKNLENSISMFETVKAVCDDNITIINSNAGLDDTYKRYLILLSQTEVLAQEQTRNRTGITIDKKKMREKLVLLVEAASGIIKAHFDSASNFDIFTSVNLSLTRLRTMRDQLFVAHTQIVIDLLTTHQAILAPFGVDAAYIATLTDIMSKFANISTQPTVARNNKSTATLQLKNKVKEVLTFLKNELDNAMLIVKITNPTFYMTYRNARKTIDSGIRHQDIVTGSITGVVKQDETNQVIPNALVEIVGTETMIITNNLGEFTIINIPPNTYTLKVSIGNFEIKMVENVVVAANEDTEIEIKLTPSV
jgi:hypothetical protein